MSKKSLCRVELPEDGGRSKHSEVCVIDGEVVISIECELLGGQMGVRLAFWVAVRMTGEKGILRQTSLQWVWGEDVFVDVVEAGV